MSIPRIRRAVVAAVTIFVFGWVGLASGVAVAGPAGRERPAAIPDWRIVGTVRGN